MDKFLCREKELKELNDFYSKAGFQMLVVYGRRRVGKSTLLREFVKGKKSIFYTAVKSTFDRNIELLGKAVLKSLSPDYSNLSFSTFSDILDFVGRASQKERIVFVIDEIPYLAESDKGILSMLQNAIDDNFQNGNMFLILCGSSISFMEDEVLSEKSPVFGRRTGQIELKPFSYNESAEFVKSYSNEDKALTYGVTGGVAKYLSLFDDGKSVEKNITDLFFNSSGYLYEEPTNLLTQEFRNVSTYNAIIEAIASGRDRVSEIADESGIEISTVSHALTNLIKTGIVRKECAITEETNKKKLLYVLNDKMFRFWYKFIPDGISLIELGQGEKYFEDSVKPYISEFMGGVFEEMCRAFTMQLSIKGVLPLLNKVGKWWGANPTEKNETDIDVVGINKKKKYLVLGECKYRNKIIDTDVINTLYSRGHLISDKYKIASYLIYSKNGFSEQAKRLAEENQTMIFVLDDLYK